MKLRIVSVCIGLLALALAAALPPEYEAQKAEAEKLYTEGSFAKANEAYHQVALTNLPPAEQRWVQFRLADSQWRSEASTQQADTTKLDQARQELDRLVRDVKLTEEKDRGAGMGIMGAAMGVGVIFGPSLGGFATHYFHSFRMPFFLNRSI